ncbi:glutamine-fructose-6-phosphate transaminase [Aureococcus anophagefferens]|nr:glutamine-fructose-6-phosphate transaminase [Aureococcus anophagefferens]
MCRWLVYCSAEPIVLADLVLNSHHSIVRQSFSGGFHPDCSDKNNMRMNADGFGLGWYGLCESGASAAIFREHHARAWSNRNLRELAGVVSSRCCFAHVRAATPGSVVSEENTHPFRYGRLLFQHNGHIEGFARVKRRLIEKLPDGLLAWVDGSTDSEYCFALLLAQLERPDRADRFPVAELEFAVLRTLAILKALGDDERIVDGFSTCNFALADGASVVITRYCDKAPEIPPPSLYYTFRCSNELKAALVSGADDAPRPAYGAPLATPAAAGPAALAPGVAAHWALVEENTIISFSLPACGAAEPTLLRGPLCCPDDDDGANFSDDDGELSPTPPKAGVGSTNVTASMLSFVAKLQSADSWRRKFIERSLAPPRPPPRSPRPPLASARTYACGDDAGRLLAARAKELACDHRAMGAAKGNLVTEFGLRTRPLTRSASFGAAGQLSRGSSASVDSSRDAPPASSPVAPIRRGFFA